MTRRGGIQVLIIGINYRPELSGIGPYTAGLAEHLAAQGNRVTVITGIPHYPGWRIGPGTHRELVRDELIDDVRVIRAAHYVPAVQNAARRALYEATFGLTGLIASRGVSRPDAILGVVPSLSGGVLAKLLGRRFSAPYGLLFQDLMGPAASQSGIAGGALVARATVRAERWSAAEARAIGVVSTSFVPYLASFGVPPGRILHVPNWSRRAEPSLSVDAVRARFGWADDRQVVVHAGNMGLKQGLEQVVDAARMAADRGDPVRFVLSGDGSQADAIRAAAHGLDNMDVLGLQPDGLHASLLAAADVLLLSERASQIDMSLPSKLTSYHAAGRPIVAAVPLAGGTASEIERSGAGIVVPAGRPEMLLDALGRLRREPSVAAELASAGPAYAEAHTSARACLARGENLVRRIASGSIGHDSALTIAA
jgi:glycosyltransferase involved in cell wall biosynthesis